MKKFLFNYRYDGADYGIEIPAESEREARERIKAMPIARYQGEVVADFKVPSLLSRIFAAAMGR